MGFAEYADKYYEMGFSIMPIRRGDKKPMMPWEKYQNERVSIKELESWRQFYAGANIAIITGTVSGILVLDVDGPEGRTSIKGKHLPPTLVARTGRGTHYYFKMPADGDIGNSVGILPKVDIRGNGGYVVAPGSIHQNGSPYEWVYDGDIAECPEWIINTIRDSKKPTVARTIKHGTEIDTIKAGLKEGGRNDACTKLAGYYLAKGFSPDDTLLALEGWNRRNRPPLPDKEISDILSSITKRDPNNGPEVNAVSTDLKGCKDVINKWLYHKDDTIVDISLAVVASTHHNGDPLWVMIVGAPSSGKTEVLRGFEKHKDVYCIDRVSKSTFVTGFTKAKGILERMGPQPKTFILQDFSTILSKPPYDRLEITDTLRQIYNGMYHAEWGNGKKVTWRGRVAMLSGCTPDIEAHGHAMGELGERFIYYRIDADDDDTRTKMMIKARNMEGKEQIARREMAEAMHGMIENCKTRDINNVKIDSCYSDWLSDLVDIATSARSIVKRNQFKRSMIEYTPHKEGPGRLYKACQVLMKGLAVVRGRMSVNEEDYAVAVKICADSIQSVRREALRSLAKHAGKGGVRAKDIANDTGYQSSENMGFHLSDLAALGLVDKWMEKRMSGSMYNAPYLFELKKSTFKKLDDCGMLDIL